MKVLMLGWELPPHNSGGLGVACYHLCKSLSKKGVDIEFILPYTAEHNIDFMKITAAQPKDVIEVIKSGIAYDSYKYIHTDGSEEWVDIYGQQLAYEHAVDQIVEETEFDVIHAHDWLTFRAGLRAKHKSNKPLVLHVHSIESDRAGGDTGNPLVREIEYLSMLLADRIIAVSAHTKYAIIREYGIPAENIEVVHNSIDQTSLEELDADNAYRYLALMKQHGYRVVVNIGRLTIQKGLPNLLRAAREVVLRAPKTLFLIVGSGEQERELLQLAAELGIGKNVIFAGFQRGKNWRDAYAIGDLFVMPSISEPFGLTPLEAIGYGTPSLISKQSGVAEVLTNCLKVDYWDVDEMANQITAVVTSDALRDELHRNSLKEYERLTWDHSADKLVDLYNRHVREVVV
ncbi:MAG: putative Glycosyl transferase, group 1 family [Candidatus Saccharibacteria bacterium]|nr:putative Glycosyl transferase, group 1 family [Candidatus Saccharibacteria bacterium]